MSVAVREIVDAWLAGDREALAAIRGGGGAFARYADAILAEQASWEAPWDHTAAYAKLKIALDDLLQDADLLNVMLRLAITIAVKLNHFDDARRMLRVMKQTQAGALNPALRANSSIAESDMAWGAGDHATAFEALTRGLSLCEQGSLFWYVVKIRRILRATTFEQLKVAESDLKDIHPFGNWRWLMPMPYPLLELNLLVKKGRFEEALASLAALRGEIAGRPQLLELEILLLYKTRQMAAARRKLSERQGVLTENSVALLRAQEALLRQDFEDARRNLEIALTGETSIEAFLVKPRLQMLAHLELCVRNTAGARKVLELLDPSGASEVYVLEWIRLVLLEGQTERARELFGSIQRKIPMNVVLDWFRDAPELAARDFAKLLETSSGDARPREADAPAMPHKIETPRPRDERPPLLIGRTPEIETLRAAIARHAASRHAVLITGEPGSGKKLIARLLHRHSSCSGQPFIAVQCSGISDALIEGELFGHTKDAFAEPTEASDGLLLAAGRGTLFLDDLSELSPRLQSALLRALELSSVLPIGGKTRRPFHARIVAAAGAPLGEQAEAGTFRRDLFARLNRLHIRVPPLRIYSADIPLLVEHFLSHVRRGEVIAIDRELGARLMVYAWPGNVRELRSVVERMALLSGDRRVLTAELFKPPSGAGARTDAASHAAANGPISISISISMSMPLRKRELQRIFKRYGELSRRDVIRLLNCAPMTADAALRALESDGRIRRVRTGAAKRTSYFGWIGKSKRV